MSEPTGGLSGIHYLALTPFMLGPVLRNRRYILANLGKFVVLGLLGMAVYQSWPTTRQR